MFIKTLLENDTTAAAFGLNFREARGYCRPSSKARFVKATRRQKSFAIALGVLLFGFVPGVLRAQTQGFLMQTFDGNICGWNSLPGVTLTYDPTQDNTGNGGGSCHVSTDYSQGGLFEFTAANLACCYCFGAIILEASNYVSLDFDVKWDNSSTVSLSAFNANYGGGTQGILIGLNPQNQNGTITSLCYSNVFIPDAATNGWVHVSAAINRAVPTQSFNALIFQKVYPASGGTAAFWLDNVQLVGPTFKPTVSAVSAGGGSFTLCWTGLAGATYSVQKSSNLSVWTILATNYPAGLPANNPIYFTDTNASGSRAFYRITWP